MLDNRKERGKRGAPARAGKPGGSERRRQRQTARGGEARGSETCTMRGRGEMMQRTYGEADGDVAVVVTAAMAAAAGVAVVVRSSVYGWV